MKKCLYTINVVVIQKTEQNVCGLYVGCKIYVGCKTTAKCSVSHPAEQCTANSLAGGQLPGIGNHTGYLYLLYVI